MIHLLFSSQIDQNVVVMKGAGGNIPAGARKLKNSPSNRRMLQGGQRPAEAKFRAVPAFQIIPTLF